MVLKETPALSKDVTGSDFEVLYIAGTARSGSTITAVLLGASVDIVSPGELTFYFRDVVLDEKACSCGKESKTCPLWSTVRRTGPAESTEGARRLADLTRSIDSHMALPSHLLRLTNGRKLARYAETQARLFQAISDASGDRMIVDSSKYAARAIALKRCLGARVRILCLTRGPSGVIHSFLKPNEIEQRQSSVPFAAAYYSTVLAQLRAMAAISGDVLEITYEQLCRTPVSTIELIESWSGLDLARTKQLLERSAPLDVGHMVTGNLMRKEGTIEFRPEREVDLPTLGARAASRTLHVWRWALGFGELKRTV